MGGNNIVWLAWRSIWRHTRRTVITIFGIAFGFLLAILFTGISDAGYGDMIDYAARLRGGHITVQHTEYLDTPSLSRTVRATRDLIQDIQSQPEIEAAVPRISGEVMLATAGKSYGASFVAYDPAAETTDTLGLLQGIGLEQGDGAAFENSAGDGIILGARLARNLGVTLGKKVVYTLTDKHGEIVTGLARVKGIIRSAGSSIESGLCLFPIDTIRTVLGYGPDDATMVSVFVQDHRDAAEVASRLQVNTDPDVDALVWSATQPDLATFISMKVNGGMFMETIIALLIAAVIFITMFVSVMERMREFGILMALGFSPGRLAALVVMESVWLALVGLVAGIAITAWPYWWLSTHGLNLQAMVGGGEIPEITGLAMSPIMPFGIYPENAVVICVLLVTATILSGLYPAWKASRVVPVDTIKLV